VTGKVGRGRSGNRKCDLDRECDLGRKPDLERKGMLQRMMTQGVV
jgi:hypothetical protein